MPKLRTYFECSVDERSGKWNPEFLQFRTELREYIAKLILADCRSDVFGEPECDKLARGTTAVAIIMFILTWHFQEVIEHETERYKDALAHAYATVLVDVVKEFCFLRVFAGISAAEFNSRACKLIDAFNHGGKPSPDYSSPRSGCWY